MFDRCAEVRPGVLEEAEGKAPAQQAAGEGTESTVVDPEFCFDPDLFAKKFFNYYTNFKEIFSRNKENPQKL